MRFFSASAAFLGKGPFHATFVRTEGADSSEFREVEGLEASFSSKPSLKLPFSASQTSGIRLGRPVTWLNLEVVSFGHLKVSESGQRFISV